MMLALRRQLACVLTEAARTGLKSLDKETTAYRELSGLDIETVLKEDINKICAVMTFSEMTRIIALAAQLNSGRQDNPPVKEEMKEIARKVVERVERELGGLKTPASCRTLLFKL